MNSDWKMWIAPLAWAVVVASMMNGCSTISQDESGDPEQLQQTAQAFHSDLRWARYDHARDSVHRSYRSTFDGIFEERGDDFEITEMRLKRAEMRDDEGKEALVQVEQEWMQLPSTTVEQERFMELWVYEDGRWLLRERLERSDYRDQDDQFNVELQASDDDKAPADDAASTGDSQR